jgi:hypothetical protein
MNTMRALLGGILTLSVLAGAASAQSPDILEKRYIAARDAAVKQVKALYAKDQSEAAGKADDAARPGLEAQLRAILGPVKFEGFNDGKLNLDALSDGDMGFGMLDGLRFDSLATKTIKTTDSSFEEPTAHITVTTQSLFGRWLREHKNWNEGGSAVPQQTEAAFRSENFWFQAIQSDAAIIRYAEVPLQKPQGVSVAFAMLGNRTQDDYPNDADEVFVAALANGRAYAATVEVEKIEVAACTAGRAASLAKAQAAYEAATARGDKNAGKAMEATEAPRQAAFVKCFVANAPKEPGYAAAVKAAQGLLDLVAK